MCGGGGTPANTTQTVIQKQDLPQWYQDYLQNVIGRASSESSGQAPIYGGQQVAQMTPDQIQAMDQIRSAQGGASPYFQQGNNYINQAAGTNPLDAASPYFDKGLAAYGQGAGYASQAAGSNIAGGVQGYLGSASNLVNQGANQNLLGLANPYIQQATQQSGLNAAQPYLNAASGSLPAATQANMNPYLSGAMNSLSNQAAMDLKNKYLPAVNDSFIKAGQFGSTRNQDITAQTIGDLSNNVMNQQAQMLNQSYGQAGQLAEQNLGLQGQLAQTAGGLGTAQQTTLLGAGSTLGTLGGAQAGLQLQGANTYAGLGSTYGNALNQQGQLQLGAANAMNQQGAGLGQYGATAGGLQNSYNGTLLNAGNASMNLGNAGLNAGLLQANALYSAGAAQQGVNQQGLTTAYNDWNNQTFYPQNQTSWLSNVVRGLPTVGAGYTTNTANPTNPAAQVGGLLTAGLSLSGGQGGGAGGAGNYGGYYRRGGNVQKFKRGGKVSFQRDPAAPKRGLGQFQDAA